MRGQAGEAQQRAQRPPSCHPGMDFAQRAMGRRKKKHDAVETIDDGILAQGEG